MAALVSVLIPAFNAEAYLDDAVQSILSQTYTDLQIVVVDDCSGDGTFEILTRYSARDHRMLVIRNDKNLGIVGALNRGLEFCRGTYVARMDADDLALPERIERQVRFLEEHPDHDLVGTDNVSFSEAHGVLSSSRFPTNWRQVNQSIQLSSPFSHNWLCRKTLYDEMHGYRDLSPVEDYDFVFRCSDAGKKMANIPWVGMKIRVHSAGITGQSGVRQQLAFHYANRLHKQRSISGADQFDRTEFLEAVGADIETTEKYERALSFLGQAFRESSILLRFRLVVSAAVSSPIMAHYLWRRASYRVQRILWRK